MRNLTLLLATACAAFAVPAAAQRATAEADVRLEKISNQYICTFDRSVPGDSVRSEAARAAGRVGGEILHTYRHSIKGFAVRLPAQENARSAMAELRASNPRITACEQDQVMKAFAQPVRSAARPGGGGAQTTPWGITRVGGPGSISGNTAWVIDTGVDFDHPDLQVDVGRSASFVSGGNGDDKNGHGTHVAGTIAAKNNSIGVVGVSPGTTVVAVQVLGAGGSGSTSGVIAGVDYVAQPGNGRVGDVANMSLGGGVSDALDQAVLDAASSSGVAFTLAAGNESDDANNHSPARAGGVSMNDEVYTVSASDSSDKLASFSNYGTAVEWAEPGVSIRSTYKGGGYATMSGTSMAAPHLAGILVEDGSVNQCTTKSASGDFVTGDPDGSADPIGCR